jgi:hypothetical protein
MLKRGTHSFESYRTRFNTPQFVIKTQPHEYKMRWLADVVVYHRVSRRFNNTVAQLSPKHKSLTFKENRITL